MSDPRNLRWDRRDVFRAATAVVAAALTSHAASASPSTDTDAVTLQPTPLPAGEVNTSDILIETLIDWGATHVFGIVGDGINPIIEALRKRQDRIRFIPVRHEESAAFMASGFAKHTGRPGACVGTTGLMNGLYDAALDGALVVALTGLTFHDLRGVRYQQGVNTLPLMEGMAVYNEEVTGPEHAIIVANRACRAALGDRGVAHLTVSKDRQAMTLSADKRSMRNPGARSSTSWSAPLNTPSSEQLQGAGQAAKRGATNRRGLTR